jgi:hypothetical protein
LGAVIELEEVNTSTKVMDDDERAGLREVLEKKWDKAASEVETNPNPDQSRKWANHT